MGLPNKKRLLSIALVFVLLFSMLSGCSNSSESDIVSITIWHVYGEQSDSPLNDLIDEFNSTVGKQKGINVKATKVSDTNTLHEAVLKSEQGGPGTEELPDIFVAYPKTVLAMKNQDLLVDYNDYLTEEEKNSFIDDFLAEGEINGKLRILPIAKSTEVLFVNKTLFDKFSEKSGATLDDLSTWEGLFSTAVKYREQMGRPFLADDYLFNYFQLGLASMDESLFTDTSLMMEDDFVKLWDPFAKSAIKGAVWLGSGYASEALRTGDAAVSFASSAGVMYYSDTVTYEDNTTEDMELITLPCPTYESGKKLAMNRGAGLCLLKTDEVREEAAMTFLRWLLEPDRNVNFVTKAGYMPVTEKGFSDYLPDAVGTLESPRYKSLYKTFMEMQQEYSFYTPPQVSFYLDKETLFEKNVRQLLAEEADIYISEVDKASSTDASTDDKILDTLSSDAMEKLKDIVE